MKFTPRLPGRNVNVSTTNPLVELLWLVGGLVLIAGIVFVFLGVLTDLAVSRMPVSMENWLGELAVDKFPVKQHSELSEHLQELLKSLPEDSPLQKYEFQAYLSDSQEVNAIALPGGRIVVYSGLLEQIETENELAMILGHELGHFAHRDHLRGLGRGLGIVALTSLLFGQGSSAGDIVSNTLLTFQLKYSQEQEAAADQHGLSLLIRHYGHAGGSTDFFARLARKSESKIPYLLASHPHPDDRISNLNQIIEDNKYPVGVPEPLSLKL